MPPRQKIAQVVPLMELVNEEEGGVGISVQDPSGKSLTLLLPGPVFSRFRRTVMEFRRGEDDNQVLDLADSQCVWGERKAG